MRTFLIPLAILALAGCDQMSAESASAPSLAHSKASGGEIPVSSGNSRSETFWFAPEEDENDDDVGLDVQFTYTPRSQFVSQAYIKVEVLDRFSRVLGEYTEGRDFERFNEEKPEQMSLSGPVAQSWDMLVCPIATIDQIPQLGGENCKQTSANGHSQFLGYSSKRITSVHHKPGRTIFDYTSDDAVAAAFMVPEQVVLPNTPPPAAASYDVLPVVTYTAVAPASPQASYNVRGVRLTWADDPATGRSEMVFECSGVSHTGSKGTCPNAGGGSGGGGGA